MTSLRVKTLKMGVERTAPSFTLLGDQQPAHITITAFCIHHIPRQHHPIDNPDDIDKRDDNDVEPARHRIVRAKGGLDDSEPAVVYVATREERDPIRHLDLLG